MQARRRDGGIVVEEKIALECRFPRKDWTDDGGSHPFEAGVEVEGKLPPGALARDDNVASRPNVRARGEIEFGVEIVERAGAVEGKPHRRQAREIDEMGKDAARGLVGIDGDGELVGRGDVRHDGLELTGRVEALRGQAEVETFGRRPERRPTVDLEARRHADHRLAERQVLHAELLDDHLDRKFWQDRARTRIGRRRRFGRKRAPQELHVADG